MPLSLRRLGAPLLVPAAATVAFVLVASGFFVVIGEPPARTLWAMVVYAVGDAYSLSETLVKTTPILLCALAVALPARLGLISVGAEGQLYLGALAGTAVVLAVPGATVWLLLPAMLLAGAVGGAVWGGIPGLLKARLNVNETITTLLMNYIGVLFVSAAVYGPWKDPGNLGWPATIEFPPAATVPHLFGTRVHLGLLIGLAAAVLMAVAVDRTRWGSGSPSCAATSRSAAWSGSASAARRSSSWRSAAGSPASQGSVRPRPSRGVSNRGSRSATGSPASSSPGFAGTARCSRYRSRFWSAG
jgi:simple sugar transport system permease protein